MIAHFSKTKKQGFTLVEVLIVGLLFVILLIFALSFSGSYIAKYQLIKEQDKLINDLKKSQNLSINAQDGKKYGLNLGSNNYVLMSETEDIKTKQLNSSISITENNCFGSEVWFEKLTGKLENDSSCSFKLQDSKLYTLIEINSSGLIKFSNPKKL